MREVLVAELDSPDALVRAAWCVRDHGFTRVEAYTPFPIPELDDALGIRRTRSPVVILAAGFAGAALSLFGLWWTNAYDYPINVGGRPLFSVPTDMPIVFELTVLAAALTAFAAVLLPARLPRLHDPLFDLPELGRTSIDRFSLVIADAFFMADDVAEAGDDERRAALLRAIEEEKVAKLTAALDRLGATVHRRTFSGVLR